jgi:hypothetical protein
MVLLDLGQAAAALHCSERWLADNLPGQFLCEKSAREHKRTPEPEQLIVGWTDREVKDFQPDPVAPPELWADDPEIWALVRQDTAHSSAFWTVILACGHVETMVTDVDWVFGRGYQSRIIPTNSKRSGVSFADSQSLTASSTIW